MPGHFTGFLVLMMLFIFGNIIVFFTIDHAIFSKLSIVAVFPSRS